VALKLPSLLSARAVTEIKKAQVMQDQHVTGFENLQLRFSDIAMWHEKL
jgi:hypothetical protein